MAERFNRKMLSEVFKDPRLMRDFEEFSKIVDEGLPALVLEAQTTADAAEAAAIAAQGTANAGVASAAAAQGTANTAISQIASYRMIATLQINSYSYSEYNTRGYVVSLCSSLAGAINVSLPSCGACQGMILCIKKTDTSANPVTAVPYGTQNIDGASSKAVSTQYERFTIVSDGLSWQVIA